MTLILDYLFLLNPKFHIDLSLLFNLHHYHLVPYYECILKTNKKLIKFKTW